VLKDKLNNQTNTGKPWPSWRTRQLTNNCGLPHWLTVNQLMTLWLHVVGPLVDLEHDYRDYERDAVKTGRNPTVDGVLIIQLHDVTVAVILASPLIVINWQIFSQSRCPHLKEDPQQRLQWQKYTNLLKEYLVHGQVTIIFIVSVCLFVCLCRVFLSRVWSDFDQTWTYVVCLGLVVSLEYRGCATPGGWLTPKKLVFLGVLGLKKLSRPTVFIGLCWFLVILYNAPILKFSQAIFLQFPSWTQIMTSSMTKVCKSCRRAMRIALPAVNHRSVAASLFL